MALKEVRNALLNQLKNDSTLVTYLNNNSDNIKHGIESGNIEFTGKNTIKVRVIQIEEDESYPVLSGNVKVDAEYKLHVVGVFLEDDMERSEDTAADLSKLIKNAISSDFTLGDVVNTLIIGRTYYREHPEKQVYYVIVPVTCNTQSVASNR